MQPSNVSPPSYWRNDSVKFGLVVLASCAALAACSTIPAPVEQMAVSRSTVERVSSQPNAVDAAPVELQQAREKLTRAERAMTEKDYVNARRFAAEAEADARVAESKASAVRGERALGEVQQSIRTLQDEINRRAPR
jgi:Domain of unknown function (DUF4398)